MLRSRIIPCLLVTRKGLVKTVRFTEPKYVGDPLNAVKIFNEKEVDELVVLDIDATVRGTEPDYALLGKLAAECRMPLCYGGGIRTVEQAVRIIKLGVEKIALSSGALADPGLVEAIARYVGSQSVVVVLDVRRSRAGIFEVWTHNATRNTARDAVEVAREMEARGVGEITLNSIDNDGMMKGYDLELVRRVREAVAVPITVLGGAGSLQDIGVLIKEHGIIGAAAGSLFVFKGSLRAVLINYPDRRKKIEIESPGKVSS
jgi:imidazole glycerol-phosphate synthase subunit HisF